MRVLITLPTFARDVRPDQLVEYEAATWSVDEVAHQRGGVVKIAMRPAGRDDGRRKIVEHSGEAFVQVLPTFEQRDELAAVVADALGTSWLTSVQGLNAEALEDWCEVATEEGGVEWIERDGRGTLDYVRLPEHVEHARHSVLLNTLAWRMAEALGDVLPGDVMTEGNPEAMLGRLLAGSTLNLDDISVVDDVLRAIERRHPTAIPDHARLIERRGEEARALASSPRAQLDEHLAAERARAEAVTPELAAVGRDGGDAARPAVILDAEGRCPTYGNSPDHCTIDHDHLTPNLEPLNDAERGELGIEPGEDGEYLPATMADRHGGADPSAL